MNSDTNPPLEEGAAQSGNQYFFGLGRRGATVVTAAGLLLGGLGGGYVLANAAASPTPQAAASAPAGGSTSTALPDGHQGCGRGHDRQTIATAIGISTAQLNTELASGKSAAQVAQAHGVDPAKVVAAVVAAENAEIDARAASGEITKAQADQAKANVQQHVQAEISEVESQETGTAGGSATPGGWGA